MKKILLATAALAAMASAAAAERYVMITHTQGTDPFWPVVEKGAKDAAAAQRTAERAGALPVRSARNEHGARRLARF